MTASPMSPRLVKGAFVGLDLFNPLASVIVFQYNPETLTRNLQAQMSEGSGERSEPVRLTGAPKETISLEVEIDATDQLEKGEKSASEMGIHPQLAALEMLVYPKSAIVVANSLLLAAGVIELIQPPAPLTLFIWGPKRVLPVRLISLRITEEAHDEKLNPIRAKVSLDLQVLTYSDLPLAHPGYGLYLAHQVVKEAMATIGSVNNVNAILGGNVSLL